MKASTAIKTLTPARLPTAASPRLPISQACRHLMEIWIRNREPFRPLRQVPNPCLHLRERVKPSARQTPTP